MAPTRTKTNTQIAFFNAMPLVYNDSCVLPGCQKIMSYCHPEVMGAAA
jgi:hypothetical protein